MRIAETLEEGFAEGARISKSKCFRLCLSTSKSQMSLHSGIRAAIASETNLHVCAVDAALINRNVKILHPVYKLQKKCRTADPAVTAEPIKSVDLARFRLLEV